MFDQAVWEKLLKLKPALPNHAQVQQRYYGDELWYILYDKASGKFHRFNAIAYALLGFMDGRNDLNQILSLATQRIEDKALGDPPEKSELVELLQYLYVADLLVCDFSPSTEEMFNRSKRKKAVFWQQLFKNPYIWKFTLLNPDRFLERMLPLARVIASPVAGLAWLALVAYALLQVGNHWPELSRHSFDHILSAQNLFLLWLIYPVLKVIHELGHGLFTKVWGGNVHEFGIVFVLGTPLPYVDATSATGFPKAQRMMVGAAGMAVEIFIAALAFIVWMNVNDGLLRDVCFNLMLIGGVSTLFFNGNPLLKFDGYHILCDLLDQPNLAARSLQQIRHFIRRYGYSMDGTVSPALSVREASGLMLYGILSFFYRFVILIMIVIVVFRHFPTAGMLLMFWLGFFQVVLPLAKYFTYLLLSKELSECRARAICVCVSFIALLAVVLFVVPVDRTTSAQGVVWLPNSVIIQSESPGEIIEFVVEDGEYLEEGDIVARLTNLELSSELNRKRAFLTEYQSRYEEAWSLDQTKTQLFEQDIAVIQSELNLLQTKVNNLVIRSPSSGVFKSAFRHEPLGSFIRQGEPMGLILNEEKPMVRVVVTQQEVGLIKSDYQGAELTLASQPGVYIGVEISQEVPKASYVLPSPVLGTAGGGRIIVDSGSEDGTKAIDRVFIINLSLPANSLQEYYYGMRTYVSFMHTPEILFKQICRFLKQAYIDMLRSD